MEQIIIYLILVLTGLCMGSFAAATVWRLRAKQLKQDKSDGEKIDKDEFERLEKLTKSKLSNDRSVCLECSYQLKWYDMVPSVSWLLLLGKCRNCKKPIGWLEPLSELGVALFFVLSYMFWPFGLASSLEIIRFVIWLVSGVVLAILFIYDQKWFLLPNTINFLLIFLGVINSAIVLVASADKIETLYSIAGSVAILSGLYWVLEKVSKGKWIGYGDIKLGLGLALLIADWRLAFIALFAANMVGCLIVLPAIFTKQLTLKSHVPFGPLLIIGTIIAMLFGNYLINTYLYSIF